MIRTDPLQILQVLVYCPPFTELFEELGKRLKADLARKTPLLEAMCVARALNVDLC